MRTKFGHKSCARSHSCVWVLHGNVSNQGGDVSSTELVQGVTLKTTLIVLAMIATVAGILSITWTVSSRLVRDPVAVSEPVTEKPELNEKVNANVDDGDSAASTTGEADAVGEIKTDQELGDEVGDYDDSWSGKPEPGSETAVVPKTEADAQTNTVPQRSTPNSGASKALREHSMPDDRELDREVPKSSGAIPSMQGNQAADPYQGDERESN